MTPADPGDAPRRAVASAIDRAIRAPGRVSPSAHDLCREAVDELEAAGADVDRADLIAALFAESLERWPYAVEASLLAVVDTAVPSDAAVVRFRSWADRPWGAEGPEWEGVGDNVTEVGLEYWGGMMPGSGRLVFLRRGRAWREYPFYGEPAEFAELDAAVFADLARAAVALELRAEPAPFSEPRLEGRVYDRGESSAWLHRPGGRVALSGHAASLMHQLERTLEWRTGEAAADGGEVRGQGEPCPACGRGALVSRGAASWALLACSREECDYRRRTGVPQHRARCPRCGTGILMSRHRWRRPYWECSSSPECDFAAPDEPTGAVHDAHEGDIGTIGRGADGTLCLACGADVPVPDGVARGDRLPGGPPRPELLERSRRFPPETSPEAGGEDGPDSGDGHDG